MTWRHLHCRRSTQLAGLFVACVVWSSSSYAVAQAPAAAESQLARRLAQPVSLAWQGQQLRPALERLAESQGVSIWLDRRIDPSASVEFAANDQPLSDTLAALAAARGAASVPFAGIIYFGPQQTADELATLAALARESLAKAPAPQRAKWLKGEPWSFSRLSEPRQLLVGLATAAGATVEGEGLVPYDLWAGQQLPSMAAVDRIVLLLAGFDLTCELSPDGRRLRVAPIERPVQITHEYPAAGERQASIESLLANVSAVRVARRGQRVAVSARQEDHDRIRLSLKGEPPVASSRRPATKSGGAMKEQRFTLKIENQPIGRVLDQLAEQLQLTVEWQPPLEENPASGRQRTASCDVRQVDLDGLLTALLEPLGLEFERDGQVVKIRTGK